MNHFTCILALAPPIFRAKKKLLGFMNFSELARTNLRKIDDYVGRVQSSLMLTSEILENHGYNVINVEEGNHGEIKKRNMCFSALREFTTTLTDTQAGGGQSGTQVAASGWKKVLKFGDGVWPPEPPHSIPDWVTMSDPTVPAPRVNRFTPRPPPGPPPAYKAAPQPYPSAQPPPPKARPTSTPPQGPSASGSQASGSAGPPPHPQAAPKPAPKPMPRRETPATEYVPPLTPQHVITYCRVLTDYTGTQVRSILNSRECIQ